MAQAKHSGASEQRTESASMNSRLTVLVAKALADTGYDLVSAMADGWFEAAISGTDSRVRVKATTEDGTLLATPEPAMAAKIGLHPVNALPPSGMQDIGQIEGAVQLYEVLRVLHSVQTHQTSLLSSRVEARLAAIPVTERTREVRQRIGQDVFREALMDLWQGRCAVTRLVLPTTLLRASHAKPWARANDAERLDPFNGLLLAIHLDAMFDTGLIAFANDGRLLCSPHLDVATREHYCLHENLQLHHVAPGHLQYLRWHLEHVFQSG